MTDSSEPLPELPSVDVTDLKTHAILLQTRKPFGKEDLSCLSSILAARKSTLFEGIFKVST